MPLLSRSLRSLPLLALLPLSPLLPCPSWCTGNFSLSFELRYILPTLSHDLPPEEVQPLYQRRPSLLNPVSLSYECPSSTSFLRLRSRSSSFSFFSSIAARLRPRPRPPPRLIHIHAVVIVCRLPAGGHLLHFLRAFSPLRGTQRLQQHFSPTSCPLSCLSVFLFLFIRFSHAFTSRSTSPIASRQRQPPCFTSSE